MPSLLQRAFACLVRTSEIQHVPLFGGPADGLILAVPRPAPDLVYAALRPMVDGAVLLATASDEMAVYVSALGDGEGIARYRREDGCRKARYLHEREVPSTRST